MFIWIIITVVPIYILHWLVKRLVRVVLPGPIEKNFPKELITKATVHNRGKYDYRCNGCLLTLIWVDKRSIYMITTIHPAVLESVEPTVKRRKPDGSRVDLLCPPCLPDYQSFMRGVDRADQRIGYYNLGRRSKKMVEKSICILD